MTDEHLMALVIQAIELKGTPYLIDAVAAIGEAHQRRPLSRHERRQERIGGLIRLLRESDPSRITRSEAA
jgi:hypothetical protein